MEDNETEGGMHPRVDGAINRRGISKGACKIHVMKRSRGKVYDNFTRELRK